MHQVAGLTKLWAVVNKTEGFAQKSTKAAQLFSQFCLTQDFFQVLYSSQLASRFLSCLSLLLILLLGLQKPFGIKL